MDCNSFFDINSLNGYVEFDKPLYSIIAKRKTAKLIYMSPKQYIYRIADGFGGLSYEDVVDTGAVSQKKVDKYANEMLSGSKFPIGYFTKDGEQQEGRHRALAAIKLGCEKIPVVQLIKISNKEFLTVVNKFKNGSFEQIDTLFKKIGFDNGITQLGYNDLRRYIDYNLQENNMKSDRVRSIVRRVLKESVINEITKTSFDAFHGAESKITKFSDSFLSGEKVIQHHGAGIYFTTNYENARMFGENVYTVTIDGTFLDKEAPADSVDVDKVIALMKMSDEEWEMEAQNYNEDPETGVMIAAQDAINYADNEADVFLRVQSSWYQYQPLDYVRNMTKLGYDGMIVDAPRDFVGDKHIIVFNPEVVTLTGKA